MKACSAPGDSAALALSLIDLCSGEGVNARFIENGGRKGPRGGHNPLQDQLVQHPPHLLQPPCYTQLDPPTRSPPVRALSTQGSKISKNGEATTSRGNFFPILPDPLRRSDLISEIRPPPKKRKGKGPAIWGAGAAQDGGLRARPRRSWHTRAGEGGARASHVALCLGGSFQPARP